MKVRFVQLESAAFLTDGDFIAMTPAERGSYCTLIFYLYCSDGRCKLDTPFLCKLFGFESCEEFEDVWERIKNKFVIREGVIRHKRVSKELAKAKKFMQSQRRAGIKGAKNRWHSHSDANGTAIANVKRNVNEKERKALSNTNTNNFSSQPSSSVRVRSLMFNEALTNIIIPRSQSDRTCFRNVTNWLVEGLASGRFNEQIFDRVLDYAKEARGGRKPASVFVTLLKKELGYRPQALTDL